MKKIKKRLTQAEEFEILKIVLDKFLWIGTFIIGYGFYLLMTGKINIESLGFLGSRIIVFILFISLLYKEYEVLK